MKYPKCSVKEKRWLGRVCIYVYVVYVCSVCVCLYVPMCVCCVITCFPPVRLANRIIDLVRPPIDDDDDDDDEEEEMMLLLIPIPMEVLLLLLPG